jgi:choline dehydrogenase
VNMGITFLTPTSRESFAIREGLQSLYVAGGAITITSSNAFDPPQIDPNLLASEFDIFTYRESVKASQRFFAAPAWQDYIVAPFQPPVNATSDNDIETYLRENAIPAGHASGTCAMSAEDAQYGVVNPDLRVKGLKGIRVVDASIMVRFVKFSRYVQGLIGQPKALYPSWAYPSPCIRHRRKGC